MRGQRGSRSSALPRLLITLAILSLTVLAGEVLYRYGLASQNLILVYILSTILIARFTDGYVFGISAALINTFLYDFLITDPRLGFSFTIGFPITLLIMLVVSLITCAITTQMKTQARLAQERESRAELMYEVNQRLLAARDIDEIARLASAYLEDVTGEPTIFYSRKAEDHSFAILNETGTPQDSATFHSPEQRARVKQILNGPRLASGSIIDAAPVSYIVLSSKDTILALIGVIGLQESPNAKSASFLQTLIGQVTLAVDLQYAFDQQQAIRIDAETEKMRGNLLRAISHDLRTPLTGMFSAASILEDQAETLEATAIKSIAMDIRENSEWLIRMVENLLAVTRISDGAMKVNKTWEIAEEVMAQSVSIVRKRFPDCEIRVEAGAEPLLVPMDPILITQVLINLLENAVKYSPSGSVVELSLDWVEGTARFCVNNQGVGIPEGMLGHLFENPPRREPVSDSVSGMGIGLSICKTILDAHEGGIAGYNRPGGGAAFLVTLPIKEEGK